MRTRFSAHKRLKRALSTMPEPDANYQLGPHQIRMLDGSYSAAWCPMLIDGRLVTFTPGQQFDLFLLLLHAATAPMPRIASLGAVLRAAKLLPPTVNYAELDLRAQADARAGLRRPLLRLRRKLEPFEIEIGRLVGGDDISLGYTLLGGQPFVGSAPEERAS